MLIVTGPSPPQLTLKMMLHHDDDYGCQSRLFFASHTAFVNVLFSDELTLSQLLENLSSQPKDEWKLKKEEVKSTILLRSSYQWIKQK